jgi:hypothetical protein
MSLEIAPETIEFFIYPGIGEVEQTITLHQRGRVKFMATYWFAQFYPPNNPRLALPGTPVRVIGREGLTLLVVSIDADLTQLQAMVGHSEATRSGLLGLIQQMGSWFANY